MSDNEKSVSSSYSRRLFTQGLWISIAGLGASSLASAASSTTDPAALCSGLVFLKDYAALRNYRGPAGAIYLTESGIAGIFWCNDGDRTEDNGGTQIRDAQGRSWKRQYSGPLQLDWFDPPKDGSDASEAFARAAQAAPALNRVTGDEGNRFPRAGTGRISVGPGQYQLSKTFSTGGREIYWDLDPAAKISNSNFLNGTLIRAGERVAKHPFGTADTATGQSVRLISGVLDEGAEVSGFTDQSNVTRFKSRDAVAFYVDIDGPAPLLETRTARYTATRVSLPSSPSSEQLYRYRKGMLIDTLHQPKYTGFLRDWSNDGRTLQVDAWYLAGGSPKTGVIPPDGPGVVLNPVTKVWAHNANVYLGKNSHAQASCGFELGTFLNRSGPSTCWGFDSVSLGSYRPESAFIARGDWSNGFKSVNQQIGFLYVGEATPLACTNTKGQEFLRFLGSGACELGNKNMAQPVYLDFHTSGTGQDYDARLIATGGIPDHPGRAAFTLVSDSVAFNGTIQGTGDNIQTLGKPALRFKEAYIAAGVITSSDERLKQQISDIPDAVLDAWAAVNFQQYRFRQAVEEKGDKARWHFGVLAQRVKEAFERKGLDPFAYGLLCYDEWAEQSEIQRSWADNYEKVVIKPAEYTFSEDDRPIVTQEAVCEEKLAKKGGCETVRPKIPAGSRYSIRYEEALVLEAALMRRTTRRLEDRLVALEKSS